MFKTKFINEIYIIAILFFVPVLVFSQQDTITVQDTAMSNKIYRQNIKTILFYRDGWDMSPPLLLYNSDEHLKLEFDDLEGDTKNYMFTIQHCDKNWNPSDLDQFEYIDGYFDDYITDFEYSFNTARQYTHYELLFPTENMSPKISGNYILKVFVDEPDSLYFTRRFMVVEQRVDITGEVKDASEIAERNHKQEVDFEIKTTRVRIGNPYTELFVRITQNGRVDNAIEDIQPKMVVGDKLNYDYDKEITFDGGNQFRSFDIKSLRYNTEYIDHIEKNFGEYDVYLKPDESRSYKVYKTIADINGKFKIKTEDERNTAIEAEYVYVHFFLKYNVPLVEGDVYILGELSDWNYTDFNKMDYDYKRKGYTKTLLLKQGYYNYMYVLLPHDNPVGEISFFEGNHSETGNEYTIWVYYHDPGKDYDELIGVTHLNSREIE
jgi:hypothetical protein